MVRLGAMGDVVRTLPAASALRAAWPGAHLAWLVESAHAGLLESQPWLDEVLVFPRTALTGELRGLRPDRALRRLGAFLRELRGRRFDLVIDFHGILKSGMLTWCTRAPLRAGYARGVAREGAQLFLTHRARLAEPRVSRYERNDALVRYLAVQADALLRPLVISEALQGAMSRALEGLRPPAIHPGTSDSTPHKRWSVEGYAQVARALYEQRGLVSVVTAGPARDDRDFAQAIVRAAPGAARLAPETPGLPELAALLSQCRVYLGGDTGPMHIASLVGTPVVQLLGATDPVHSRPYEGTPYRRVLAPGAEAFARTPRWRRRRDIDLGALSAQSVLSAVLELLAETEGAQGAAAADSPIAR